MCPSAASDTTGYWYSGNPELEHARAVLEALRAYRAAEQDMRRRIRDNMKLTEKDMQALHHMMRAHQSGKALGPRDLSRLLSLPSASTTALIDRLVSSGHIQRRLHPTDRRALELIPMEKSDTEMRESLGRLHERFMKAAASLSMEEAEVVTRFLLTATETVQQEPQSRDQ